MEGSLSEIGTPSPHNADIPHVLVDGYTHTHTHTYIYIFQNYIPLLEALKQYSPLKYFHHGYIFHNIISLVL